MAASGAIGAGEIDDLEMERIPSAARKKSLKIFLCLFNVFA